MSNRTHAGIPANRPAVQLTITLDPNGAIQVTGPIDNKVLCFGLLECAKETISNFNRQDETRPQATQIEIATPADLAANGIQIDDKRGP